jgi:hypothetical protein
MIALAMVRYEYTRTPWSSCSALRSARSPVYLIGSPINYANRLMSSPITSQSTEILVPVLTRFHVGWCRYLPGISPAQPGLKIAFQREDLLSQFPDAFEPYLHFGVTLRQPLQGTLFRFPLRCGRSPGRGPRSGARHGVAPLGLQSELARFCVKALHAGLLTCRSCRGYTTFRARGFR